MNVPAKDAVLAKLKHVDDQLLSLTMHHELWSAMNNSLRDRPTNVDGTFWTFFTTDHFRSAFVTLRAAADSKGDRSLFRAINPIAAGALKLTLEEWLGRPGGPTSTESLSEWRRAQTAEFYRLCGKETPVYPKELAARHQVHLTRVTGRIKGVVDKEIAHWDNAAVVDRPVLATLRRALRQCGWVHDHYYYLLTGTHAGSRNDHLDSDWKAGLLHDWFPDERRLRRR